MNDDKHPIRALADDWKSIGGIDKLPVFDGTIIAVIATSLNSIHHLRFNTIASFRDEYKLNEKGK